MGRMFKVTTQHTTPRSAPSGPWVWSLECPLVLNEPVLDFPKAARVINTHTHTHTHTKCIVSRILSDKISHIVSILRFL